MMRAWYVAKAKPRNEHKIHTYLGQHGIAVYAPEIVVMRRGRRLTEALFPGYVFVQTDPLSGEWPLVRWAHGLSYILPDHRQPLPVSDASIDEIRSRVEWWNAGGWIAAFQPGDRVLIASGSLRTLEGIFQRYIPGKQRCEVLLSLMGRPQRVQVEITHLHSAVARRRFATLGRL